MSTPADEICCSSPNQYATDEEGEVIYPDLCRCICHAPDDE